MTRLEHELALLAELRMSSHFLLAWDLERKARAKGMIVSTTYGSLNCLVGYLLGLSSICPLEHGMLFESFSSLQVGQRPALSLRSCPDQRDAIVCQLAETYGHIALDPHYQRFNAIACFTDLGPLMGLSEQEVWACKKLISGIKCPSLEACLQTVPEFKKLCDQDARIQRVVAVGSKLEGHMRMVSPHPSTLIVSSRPLSENIPVLRFRDCRYPVIKWERPVIDALGLTRLTLDASGVTWILRRTREIIRAEFQPQEIQETVLNSRCAQGLKIPDCDVLNLTHMPCDDPRVFGLFMSDDLVGIEYGGAEAARNAYQAVEVCSFESLTDAVALQYFSLRHLLPMYRERRLGREPIPQIHPTIDGVTASTYGLVFYQDQAIQIFHELVGQPRQAAAQALHELLETKAMAPDLQQPLIAVLTTSGLTPGSAKEVVESIRESTVSAFCKGGVVWNAVERYWSAYLKVYFPRQFMQAYAERESLYQPATRQA